MNKTKKAEKKSKKAETLKYYIHRSQKTEDQQTPFHVKEPGSDVTVRKYKTEDEAQDFCDRANREGEYADPKDRKESGK